MPLKLNVGISKKVGLPGYSSLGASCNVEVELDHALLFENLEGFHQRVKQAYTACRHAVTHELAGQQETGAAKVLNGQAAASATSDSLSNGLHGNRASQKQIGYLKQLAGQIRGLGVRRLEKLVETMFSKPQADLSSLDASKLIDRLKDVKSGKIELATVLDGSDIIGNDLPNDQMSESGQRPT